MVKVKTARVKNKANVSKIFSKLHISVSNWYYWPFPPKKSWTNMCASRHLSFRDVEGVSVEIHSCLPLCGGHTFTWAIWQHCRAFLKYFLQMIVWLWLLIIFKMPLFLNSELQGMTSKILFFDFQSFAL